MPNGNLRVGMRKSRRCRCLAGLSDGVCVLNAVNRALKSPKWIFQRAHSPLPVTHTQENIEFQTGNDFLGLEPAGCEYQKLFTASISEVEKNSNFGAALRAIGTESSLRCLFRVIFQWTFQAARSRINIFQSTMNHTWVRVPKEAWSTFHPLRKMDEIYFPAARRETFFLHASIARPRAVAAADGRS